MLVIFWIIYELIVWLPQSQSKVTIKKSAVYMFVYELLCELFFINYL